MSTKSITTKCSSKKATEKDCWFCWWNLCLAHQYYPY